MPKEMDDLLTQLDELIMEAHDKGYSFVFDNFDDTTNTVTTLYSASETFGIDIIEWD